MSYDPDDVKQEEVKIDVENVVKSLFNAYPNCKYICLNNALTIQNEDYWKDHWYFAGFPSPPVYSILDGYWSWVANEDIHISDDEWALFFLHISSKDHYWRGIPIQQDPFDFASSRWFCWGIEEDGEITQYVVEEPAPDPSAGERAVGGFDQMMRDMLLNPALSMLTDGRDKGVAAGVRSPKLKRWASKSRS